MNSVFKSQALEVSYHWTTISDIDRSRVAKWRQNTRDIGLNMSSTRMPNRVKLQLMVEEVEESKLSLQNYTNEFKLRLEEQFLSTQQSIDEMEAQQNGLYIQLNESIRTKESAIARLEEDERSINQSLGEQIVRAPQDGVVNVVNNLEIGDLVQAGTEVLTIVPSNNSEYIVQLAVQNKDIANIKQGDDVEFSFLALSSKDYGHLEGTLTLINSDATVDQQSGTSYYAVEANLNNKALYNNKGEEAEIKTGMLTEAHIITRSEKILFYLLEKIDLKE